MFSKVSIKVAIYELYVLIHLSELPKVNAKDKTKLGKIYQRNLRNIVDTVMTR